MPEGNFTQPKVSIVIPYFNGKKYLRTLVNHLLDISYDIELVIVNDGSTDGSEDFLLELSNNVPQVKVISKKNEGIVSARNYGIEHSSGEYIMFVDQDDYPVSQTIDKAIQVLDDEKCALLIWATDQINDRKVVSRFTEINKDTVCDKNTILTNLLPTLLFSRPSDLISDLGQIWACIFQKKFIDENHICFHKFIDFEDDNIFILDSLCVAESIALIQDVGYIYRVRNDSYSRGIRYYKNYSERLAEFNEYYLNKVRIIGLLPDIVEKYSCFLRQMTVYKLLINYAVKPDKSEWRIIISIVKDNKEAFKKDMLLKPTRFNRFVYWSVRLGIPKAVIVAYRNILKRKHGTWTVFER